MISMIIDLYFKKNPRRTAYMAVVDPPVPVLLWGNLNWFGHALFFSCNIMDKKRIENHQSLPPLTGVQVDTEPSIRPRPQQLQRSPEPFVVIHTQDSVAQHNTSLYYTMPIHIEYPIYCSVLYFSFYALFPYSVRFSRCPHFFFIHYYYFNTLQPKRIMKSVSALFYLLSHYFISYILLFFSFTRMARKHLRK